LECAGLLTLCFAATSLTKLQQAAALQIQQAYNATNTARDKKWREIRIRVTTRPEAAVRTREGYYATDP